MQESYTYNYYSKMEFNTNATDEEIMLIASLAEEKAYKVNKTVKNNIYKYASSFEILEMNNSSVDVFIN